MEHIGTLINTPQGHIYCTCLLSLILSVVCWRWLPGRRRVEDPATPQSTPVALTLRLRGLPDHTTPQDLRVALAAPEIAESGIATDSRPGHNSIIALSLTQSIGRDLNSRVATICFSHVPSHLQSQIPRGNEPFEKYVRLDSIPAEIKVDTHFLRFTPLYWPDDWEAEYDLCVPVPSLSRLMDCSIVAVTGWAGKAFDSWKPKDGREMWLRDWLGQDLKRRGHPTRVLTYGYDSKVANCSNRAGLRDFGSSFLEELSLLSDADNSSKDRKSRPLILIGHSLGGLLIKQALILAHDSSNDEYKSILRRCIGLVMFGVPNLGMENTALKRMTEGHSNEALAQSLNENAFLLDTLVLGFNRVIEDQEMAILAVYELKETPTVEWKNGKWQRTGPKVLMVPRESACKLGAHAVSLASHKDHSSLVKFSDRDDVTYQQVLKRLVRMAGTQLSPVGFGVPSDAQSYFIGRQKVLEKMEKCFAGTHGPRVYLLHGGGGMGKTQVALEYTRRHFATYDTIAWVQANSLNELRESFRSLSRKFDIKDAEDPVCQVLMYLSKKGGYVLLIYDNLDDRSILGSIQGSHKHRWGQNMKVLITTRDEALQAIQTTRHESYIGPLAQAESEELLQTLIDDESIHTTGAIPTICEELGHMPLAIRSAAAYIRFNATPAKQYLELLTDAPEIALKEAPIYAVEYTGTWKPSSRLVWNTWETSLESFKEGTYAREWFFLSCFLGTTIPRALFSLAYKRWQRWHEEQGPGSVSHVQWLYLFCGTRPWSVALMDNELSKLRSLSLVRLDRQGEPRYLIHPMVQQWARTRPCPDQKERYLVMAASLLHACAEELLREKDAEPETTAGYHAQQCLLPHVHECLSFSERRLGRNIAEMLPLDVVVTFANYYIHDKKPESASEMLQIGLRRRGGDVHQTTAAQRLLSLALRRQGKLSEALSIQREALSDMVGSKVASLTQGSLLLRAEEELATIHRDSGNLDDAISIQQEVIARSMEQLGDRSLQTLHAKSCLATILSKKGDYAEALALEKEVLDTYNSEPKLRQRPEVLDKMRNLAITHYNRGEYDEAIELERSVLAEKKAHYGEHHLEAASAMHNLAMTYLRRAMYRKALPLYTEAHKIRKEALGETHHWTQKTLHYLDETRANMRVLSWCAGPVTVDSGLGMEPQETPPTK